MTCVRTLKLLNKMENKELEEKSLPTEQVTSTVRKPKPKDPGRIAAGKKLAEHAEKNLLKKAREAKKAGQEIPKEESFSMTQILSVVSIVVSIAGLYYKRKELMSLVTPRERRVGRTEKISEEDLERLRESEASKLKPMD